MFSLKSSSTRRESLPVAVYASPLCAPPTCVEALPLVPSVEHSQPLHVFRRVHMAVACEVRRDLKTRNCKHSSRRSACLSSILFWPRCTLTLWLKCWLRCTLQHTDHMPSSTSPPCHCYEVDSSKNSPGLFYYYCFTLITAILAV